jgi:drug/metabolite transporter (DMT)-like permease
MPRGWMLAASGLCMFAVVSVVMLKVMPGPLKDFDYMVIGSVATLVALMVVFVVIISTGKSRDVFFKKRKK